MNGVDIALAVLLILCAVRGYGRGFVVECCGLLAVALGLGAALRFTGGGTALLEDYVDLPTMVAPGVVFLAIFIVMHTLVNLIGALFDRLTRAGMVWHINRLAGAVFGAGKAVVVVGFVLLFMHLFPFLPTLDGQIMRSTIGRPLVAAATRAVRVSAQSTAEAESPNP